LVRRRILALAVAGALAAGGGAALAAANGGSSSPAKKPAKTHPAAKDPAQGHHCPLRDQTSGSNL